jgi:hypothetical protein
MRSEHPELRELMLWQSGELASDESAIVAAHLDNCETCRNKVESMRSIYARAAQVDPAALRRKKPPAKVFMAGTSAVVIAALLFMSVTEWVPEARADSLLAKAVQQESAEAPHGLRVRSGTESCLVSPQWAVYDRASNQTFCNTVSANLRSAGWGWNDLLSAKSFEHWRASLKKKHDSVHKLADTTEIETNTQDGSIREAAIRLRSADYHPVSARFQFADANGQDAEIEVEESKPSDIPTEMALSIPTPTKAPQPHSPQQPAILDALDVAEARTRLALHHAGADTNVLLAVDREPGAIKVWGVVPTDTAKSVVLAALENIASVQLAVQTEAEQEQAHGPLPWQSFHGNGLPLAASQMQSLFQNDSQGHEKFLSAIDATTLRLVGEARTRDALLRLAARINSSEYAKPLHEAADEITAHMTVDVESLAQQLQPLAPIVVKRRVLTFQQAEQLYTLTHEVAFMSQNQSTLSLDDALRRIQALLA